MRLVYAILTLVVISVILVVGCEPQPEILAMKKERVSVDTKKTSYYRNGMLDSVAISTRNNGIDDMWQFYQDGVLVRVDEDLNFDGIVDKTRTFDPETGTLLVTKIDTDFDGVFEVVEEFEEMMAKSPEQIEEESQVTPIDEMVTIAQPQDTAVYRETIDIEDGYGTAEIINTQEEMIVIEPTPPARTSTIIIEEDEFPRSNNASGGSYFEPLEVNPGTGSVTPARNSKIVPAPVFTHPSDSLED